MIPNHKTMPTEQLREEMLSRIPESTWENDFEQSPQNINWMFVVYNIELCETADDLNDLLSCIETHYAGPISIHEGWGGCEADSNAELIADKLRFDLGESPSTINAQLYLAAVEAEFVDYQEVEDALAECSYTHCIGVLEDDSSDCLYLEYAEVSEILTIHAYGHGDLRYRFVETSRVEINEARFMQLCVMLGGMTDEPTKAKFIRMWAAKHGAPLQPR